MTPSPFSRLASATVAGLVSPAAQVFAGLKSLPSGIGSDAGAGAADVLLKVGTTLAPALVHEDARLFTVRASLGGSEVEFIRVQRPVSYGRGVLTVDSRNVTNTRGLVLENQGAGASGIGILNASGGVFSIGYLSGASFGIDATNRGLHFTQNSNAYDSSKLVKFDVLSGAGMASTIPAFDFSTPSNMVATALLMRVRQNSVDRFTLDQSGNAKLSGSVIVNGYANSEISCSGSWLQLGTGAIPVRTGSYFQSTAADLMVYGPGRVASANTLRLASDSLGGAAGDSLVRIGAYLADGSVVGGAKLTSWVTGLGGTVVEKAFVGANGEFESAVTGAGIVLKSPNGTRWRLTITNAGATAVAAA